MASEPYGLLIDFEWCTGCHACEIAGKNANHLASNEWCIKVSSGQRKVGDRVVFDYRPQPTQLCNLCAPLTSKGKLPACAHHCPPQVIRFGSRSDLERELQAKPTQTLWILEGK
jgi:Fe-S-cluster-containing dehydrogenase component